MITDKQKVILEVIINYIEKEKISPTVRELCEIIGVKSPATIHTHLNKLEENGYISKRKDSPRSLRVLKTCLKQ